MLVVVVGGGVEGGFCDLFLHPHPAITIDFYFIYETNFNNKYLNYLLYVNKFLLINYYENFIKRVTIKKFNQLVGRTRK